MSVRKIQTTYYDGKKLLKTNYSAYANTAILHCVDHLQLNHYGARTAEIFDSTDGTLHAVLTRSIAGKIEIIFKREVKEGM